MENPNEPNKYEMLPTYSGKRSLARPSPKPEKDYDKSDPRHYDIGPEITLKTGTVAGLAALALTLYGNSGEISFAQMGECWNFAITTGLLGGFIELGVKLTKEHLHEKYPYITKPSGDVAKSLPKPNSLEGRVE